MIFGSTGLSVLKMSKATDYINLVSDYFDILPENCSLKPDIQCPARLSLEADM